MKLFIFFLLTILLIGYNNCSPFSAQLTMDSQGPIDDEYQSAYFFRTTYNKPIVIDFKQFKGIREGINKVEFQKNFEIGTIEYSPISNSIVTYIPTISELNEFATEDVQFKIFFENGTISPALNLLIQIHTPIQIEMAIGSPPGQSLRQMGLETKIGGSIIPHIDLTKFAVRTPLWSDYALKQRFFYLPEGQKIDFAEQGQWNFPVGTILIKKFLMDMAGTSPTPIETRIMIKKQEFDEALPMGGWESYAYKWNEDRTDALLVTDGEGENNFILDITAGANGGPRTQNYSIPTRTQCLDCHSSGNGVVRGLRTEQLNSSDINTWDSGTPRINQIVSMAEKDLFNNPQDIPANLEGLTVYRSLEDGEGSDFDKLKSYLSVHCASCHFDGSPQFCDLANNDFSFGAFTLDTLEGVGAPVAIIPGDSANSPLHQAIDLDNGGRMPLIGTTITDPTFREFLRNYIDSL